MKRSFSILILASILMWGKAMADGGIKIAAQPGPQMDFLSTSADMAVFGGARGGGKAIELSMPVPMPSGWTTIGELKAGDRIFSQDGSVTTVTQIHPIHTNLKTYRFTFDDGTVIESCSEHQWLTYDKSELWALRRRTPEFRAKRRENRPSRIQGNKSEAFTRAVIARNKKHRPDTLPPPSGTVRSTEEIVSTLRRTDGETNHAIPLCERLDLPQREVPIDPYLFGVWLGDGTATDGAICSNDKNGDQDFIINQCKVAGWKITNRKNPLMFGVSGLVVVLKKMGVYNNKHIPIEYLRSSPFQRLALLQGLMDTDGTVSDHGSAEFYNSNRRIIDAVYELITSLGWKARIREKRSIFDGKDYGLSWRIKWTPSDYVFRLPRKRDKQRLSSNRTTKFRYIVNAEPVPSKPMRCITVDHPSGLYLIGKSMVPTHNTWAALAEPIRHLGNPNFGAVIFRREYPEIKNEGGLWDKSLELYPYLGGRAREGYLDWRFPSRAKIRFAHLQHEKDSISWRGTEIPLIIFDQLESFTWRQFWDMLSCNRSTCGVKPYVRATCNPDPDHPLRQFLIDGGYIDEESGFAIGSQSGRIRWFARVGEEIFWGDSRDELIEKFGDDAAPKSFTFIRSSVYDNKILLEKDPGYLANLKVLPRVDRERYLGDIKRGGNWNVRETAGMFFQRSWFEIVDAAPALVDTVRYWDRAATETKPGQENKASWTAGLCMGKSRSGVFYITDVDRFQGSPLQVEERVANVASQDGKQIRIGIEEDPGQAGKAEAQMYVRKLAGYNVSVNRVHERKGVRARPLSAQAEAGNVKLVRGPWNEAFLREAQNFDGSNECVSDQVDAASGAFHLLTKSKTRLVWGRS